MISGRRAGVRTIVGVLPALAALLLAASASSGAQRVIVSILSDTTAGPGTKHGLAKLTAALKAKGLDPRPAGSVKAAGGKILIVAAAASTVGPPAQMHKTLGVAQVCGPETLRIRKVQWKGRQVLLVSGGDDRGLMYALLDIADRVGWADDAKRPLSEVHDVDEAPAVAERALSKYTMHARHFESTFHDEAYWAGYLDMLARNRFNTFALLFAYENGGYFAPPYPYFFNVEGFDDVRVVGLTAQQQKRNLDSLNRIIRMTHARGMNFTLGIWDHIYRGGVQGPTAHAKRRTKGLVWGVTAKTLVPYTKAGLTGLLKKVPDLDAIQFRMHGESGLSRKEMATFWPDIYQIMKRHGPGIRFDARAKNFPHALIDKAVAAGVDIRMCTKYWMEQMGMPFHPTHIHPRNQRDRRHGYADMLRYPRQYKMHWRLWNGGTTRVLLWGDPEYVRRLAGSTHLYDGEGFEVNEPMATKMQDHPHDKKPFDLLTEKYRYTDREYERYWHFFQVFGRLGYNPKTPPEVWQREFQRRFGKAAAPFVEQGLHRASQILPRIVTYSYPYNHFPTTRGWAEKQRMGDIDFYSRALPSDTQQFLSMDAAAKNRISGGKKSAKRHPERSSRWFARTADDVLALVARAERNIGKHKSKEFVSTMVDLRILAGLARYHSHRALSGASWAAFKHSQDAAALDDAIAHEGRAVEAWADIVAAAGDVYHDDLMMGRRGSGLSGHWKDELAALKAGLARMKQQRKDFRPKGDPNGPTISHAPIRRAVPGRDLVIRATIAAKEKLTGTYLNWSVDGARPARVRMEPTAEPFVYRAVIPGAKVTKGLHYYILATIADKPRTGPAKDPDDLDLDEPVTASIFAPTMVVVDGKIVFPALIVSSDTVAPAVKHQPVATAPAEKPLTITAEVRDPSGVKWVRLRYRSVTQFEDYRTLAMTATGKGNEYRCVVPGKHIPARWDFMYLIEVMDNAGNGAIWPDLNERTPYIVVRLKR